MGGSKFIKHLEYKTRCSRRFARFAFPLLPSLGKGSCVLKQHDFAVYVQMHEQHQLETLPARRGVVMKGFWLQVLRRGLEVFNRSFATE